LIADLAPNVRRINRGEVANWKPAIDNELAVAEGFEPSHGRINNAVPYQLGYATKRISDCESRIANFLQETRPQICQFVLP
jgi:hypothetical protein